jgi:hypothetical protein
VAEEKDDEIERLRRMFAVREKCKEPSRLKKIMTRLRTRKIKNGMKQEKKTDAA